MFDQPNPNPRPQGLGAVPNRPSASPPNLPSGVVTPLPLAPPPTIGAPTPPQVEDMFAQTESAGSATIARPTRPGEASQMPITPAEDLYGGRSLKSNKPLVIILVIVGALIVAGAAWAMFFFVGQAQKIKPLANVNQNINTNTNVNANINANQNTNTNTNVNTNTNNINANVPVTEPPTDSDNDGLSDAEERQIGTDPKNFDTDNDGLFDRIEVQIFKTDPLNPDTDGDGYKDGVEVVNGYDPTKPGSARLYEVP